MPYNTFTPALTCSTGVRDLALVFTHRSDLWLGRIAIGTILATSLGVAGAYYYGPPEYTRVGYQPTQPVAFSHQQHVGQLKMDCRYCHTHVEESPHSNVPTTQTCMQCHSLVAAQSPKLAAVRESWQTGDPIDWLRIHKVPEYVYYNHAVHVRRGVGCTNCHGKLNEMPVVYEDKPLSMGWCLNCHRNSEKYLMPADQVLNPDYVPKDDRKQVELGEAIKAHSGIKVQQTCGTCHR